MNQIFCVGSLDLARLKLLEPQSARLKWIIARRTIEIDGVSTLIENDG